MKHNLSQNVLKALERQPILCSVVHVVVTWPSTIKKNSILSEVLPFQPDIERPRKEMIPHIVRFDRFVLDV